MSNEIELKTREISFCDKIANNVLTKESKAFILDKLKEKYDISITHRGAIIVNQNILKNLERNPHIIGVKSSGTNYFLSFQCRRIICINANFRRHSYGTSSNAY